MEGMEEGRSIGLVCKIKRLFALKKWSQRAGPSLGEDAGLQKRGCLYSSPSLF